VAIKRHGRFSGTFIANGTAGAAAREWSRHKRLPPFRIQSVRVLQAKKAFILE
jgi:hypothetical protein